VGLFQAFAAPVSAHHSGHALSVPSTRCGWTEGESLRDRRNLSEFCSRWVPGDFRIRSAAADRERLWLEAPRELASVLRSDDHSTAALLREWLRQWRTISGYNTASIVLLQNHIEFAKVYTTMAGDVVSLR
jgi:hypothetical protein